MKAIERRENILRILAEKQEPVSGVNLAKELNVSRQVIVQDIAILRAAGNEILSMNQGYLIKAGQRISRVFKIHHTNEQVADELNLIVDLGGSVKDVFVYHRAYGVIKGELDIKSRFDVEKFVEKIASGKSNLLLNVTSGYHYHTVFADSVQLLDIIQEKLWEKGFLATLQDHEPVDFN